MAGFLKRFTGFRTVGDDFCQPRMPLCAVSADTELLDQDQAVSNGIIGDDGNRGTTDQHFTRNRPGKPPGELIILKVDFFEGIIAIIDSFP